MKPPIVLPAVIMKGSHDAITTWSARIVSEAIIWLIVPIDHIIVTTYHVWRPINDTSCFRFNWLNSFAWSVTVQYLIEKQVMMGLTSTILPAFKVNDAWKRTRSIFACFIFSGYCNVVITCIWHLCLHFPHLHCRHHRHDCHHCHLYYGFYIFAIAIMLQMTTLL